VPLALLAALWAAAEADVGVDQNPIILQPIGQDKTSAKGSKGVRVEIRF